MKKPEAQLLIGDCRERLKELPAQSVHCCITSPPYYNQRDYGAEGQIGLEKSPDCLGWARGEKCGECFICSLLEVFEEVRRVLRDDATLWVNLGDKYSSGGRKSYGPQRGKQQTNKGSLNIPRADDGMGEKQLLGTPWRFALAMQAAGWILRSDVIWYAPNKMPGSQRDRVTTAHEYVFMFAKQPKYFFDLEAIKEKGGGHRTGGPMNYRGVDGRQFGSQNRESFYDDRTKRSVWTISVASEKEAHFAVYPEKLVLPCLLAGTSERGCCPSCGAPWERVVEREREPTRPGKDTKVSGDSSKEGNRDPERHVTKVKTIGWEPSCSCGEEKPVPCTVLDPFGGSATTAAVALKKGRAAIICELSEEYAEIAKRKLKKAKAKAGFML